jgi:hypothetical protein
LYFGERRIEGSYKLLVNGLKTTVGKFFELLKESDAYSFIVKVIGIGEINLDIFQVKDRAGDVVYGFKADAKGKLSPVPVEVDFDAGGSLVGFHTLKFIKANPTFRLTRLQVARLLDESCEHWQVADERSLQILNIGIESANINQVLKKVCKLKINLEKKAPDFILGQILVS